MNELCTDIGYQSLIKYGEETCGDHVEILEEGENSAILVLADGLGSGVKANILSTLTSKIISTMIANNMSIEECVSTIASTLPICEKRGLAYSTFTIIHVVGNKEAEIIQFDNPFVILLRDGRSYDYEKTALEIGEKLIYQSKVDLQLNDLFIAMSDGAIYAGVGRTLNYGWQLENIITFMENVYKDSYSAKAISNLLLEKCNSLYESMPGDDTTISAIKIRQRQPVNLMIGPPKDPKDVTEMFTGFFAIEGIRIVCGGTTSQLAAAFLGKELRANIEYLDPEIPPTAEIDGVDLVTEGVITMNRVLKYARSYLRDNEFYTEWLAKRDGASRIARLLFEEATDIVIYAGMAMNPAHQNPDLPINLGIKIRIVEELADCLKEMGKRVKVSFF